jgi:hypothetical protein
MIVADDPTKVFALNSLMRDIRACPSLPNLANLVLIFYSDIPNRHVLLDLMGICKNLRRLHLGGSRDHTKCEPVAYTRSPASRFYHHEIFYIGDCFEIFIIFPIELIYII